MRFLCYLPLLILALSVACSIDRTEPVLEDGKFYPLSSEVTFRDEKGKLHCRVHQIPLTEVRGYWTGRPVPMISPTEPYIKLAGDYPNHVGLAESLVYSEFTPKRHWFRYCEDCHSGLSEALAKCEVENQLLRQNKP